jgi:hypothetical protein
MGLGTAFKSFFRAISDQNFSAQVDRLLRGEVPSEPPKPSADAEPVSKPVEMPKPKPPGMDSLKILAVLQRDGRFLDFLGEDISGYSDDQIGAAVRDIHRDCKKVLAQYVDLVPIIDSEEGNKIEVPTGFNPEQIRLTGNVRGQPPFRGTLTHKGWKATAVRLPATEADDSILAPAEVEL